MNPTTFARAILITLLAVLALSVLTGCGTSRKFKQTTNVDSTSKVSTITTRKVDTTIRVPQSNVTASKPVDNLIKGDSLVTENDQVRVAVTYDPETGNIEASGTVKPREVPIIIDEVIKQDAEVNVQRNEEVKEKEPQGLFVLGGFLAVFLLIFCILIALVLRRR